ncbi:MAG: hypothetical protein ACKO1Q_03685, partial [Vulcanococcus sp.]
MSGRDPFSDLIAPFSRRGVDLGLDRLRRALAELGHPERHFQAVQVAGTNGKGSICSFVESGLRSAGIRCGLYSSPHLVSWTERIRFDASPMLAKASTSRRGCTVVASSRPPRPTSSTASSTSASAKARKAAAVTSSKGVRS